MRYLNHFLARVLGLILIPISVYIFSFWLHFTILNRSGPGDAQMSSLFQAQLVGNNFHTSPIGKNSMWWHAMTGVELAYGSRISLKNNGYAGGLLHSHVQAFPHGSKQQQVTCYHYRDTNNEFIIRKTREDSPYVEGEDEFAEDKPIEFLKHGDVVRLVHKETGRNLHSHPVAAPVSKADYEISAYGNETVGDSNDYWVLEIVDDLRHSNLSAVRTLTSRIRFRHKNLKCVLRSHNVVLPEWGFKQSEVVCDRRDRKDDNNLWNVEQHWNDRCK